MIWLDNTIITLDIPEESNFNGILKNQLIVQLKSDWTVNAKTYKSGTLLSLNFTELLKGNKEIQVVIAPDEFSSISGVSITQNHLILNLLTNVTDQLYIYSFGKGIWSSQKVKTPQLGTISIITTDEFSDEYYFSFQNFLTPTTLYTADAGKNTMKALKSLPAYFDAGKYEVKQFKTKSNDGTLIPYFMVFAKNIKYDGKNPTLITAYGGFDISRKPSYISNYGDAWLDQGVFLYWQIFVAVESMDQNGIKTE